MKLIAFNGSPRGLNSNSNTILDWMMSTMSSPIEKYPLNHVKAQTSYIDQMETATHLLFVFPLYADSMPAIVMNFFEILGQHKDKIKNKKVMFVIHSGFPESSHSHPLKNYLIEFTNKMEWELIDVVIKGGSEAYRAMPEKALEKHKKRFAQIGHELVTFEKIDPVLIDKLARPVHFNAGALIIVRLVTALGISNMYFDGLLKKNGAIDKSFDRPYIND